MQSLYWELQRELAGRIARQIVRITLEDAEAYAALRAEQERAGRDALTGAYNRRGLVRRLHSQYHITNEPVRHDTSGHPLPPVRLTYFYGDVNGLKWINDTLGHHIGDCVIVEVTGRINELYRESDAPIVYRQGGDEFGVILGNTTNAEAETFINDIMGRQLSKSRSEEYRGAMQRIANKLQEVEQSRKGLRPEAKRNRDSETDPRAGIRYDLYINGEFIAPLYDIVTAAVGVSSGSVNNLAELEQLRRAAETAMFDAKRHFPKETRGHG